MSNWIQLSRLINVLNTRTILEFQPIMLCTYPEHLGCFSVLSPCRDKTDIKKVPFGVRQVEFLGRAISPEGISPQARKIQIF